MNRKEIATPKTEGQIPTSPQSPAIKRIYTPQPRTPGKELIFVLGTLAAILIVVGALIQAISHWQDITPLMRTIGGMLIMVAAWVGAYLLREKKPGVAECLVLVAAGMWGANIVLHNILFELDVPAVNSFFIFFIGVAPVPFLLRQRILIAVVAVSSFILYTMMLHAPQSSWLHIASQPSGAVLGVFVGLALLWWLVGEKCRGHKGTFAGYYWISIPSYLTFLALMQYHLLHNEKEMSMGVWGWITPIVVLAMFLLLKPKFADRNSWAILAVATSALVPLAVLISGLESSRDALGLLIFSIYAMYLMMTGVKYSRPAWINYGAIAMVFVGIDLLIHISRSLTDSGLILMASGLVLLVFTFLLEGQRRRLIKQVTEQNSTTPSKQ